MNMTTGSAVEGAESKAGRIIFFLRTGNMACKKKEFENTSSDATRQKRITNGCLAPDFLLGQEKYRTCSLQF